jgi:putative nucleotidyltransferase with HDIG domain
VTAKAKPRFSSWFLWAVPSVGLCILAYCSADAATHYPGSTWIALSALTLLVSAYAIRVPGSVVRISVSETLVFLSTLLYGPSAGAVTAAVDACVMSLRLRPGLRTPQRILFNVGTLTLSVWPSAHLYFYLAELSPAQPNYSSIGTFVGPLYIFATTVFAINSSLVAIAVGLEKGISAYKVWRSQFLSLSGSYLASAAIAAILLVLANAKDYTFVALLLPLIVVSFLTVRATLGRLGDEHQHLLEVNRLYLSTIETLAMAIDAKDQVTHGHIRRVQRYAVSLARVLGVSDETQIRAIEAAALLHDMGKLAIPEFILNKPGKLTPREFNVMKTHAAVGADILSSIQFPYPVIPIVRHHHENWDGTGYPDGIGGADIPIGARILAVVDCYDALTSHRPYRPAMASERALEILAQRRGKMYDPLIVDTFVREHASLRAASELQDVPTLIKSAHADVTGGPEPLSDAYLPKPPIESLRMLASLAPFPVGSSAISLCRQHISDLRAILQFDTAAIFVLDDVATVLRPAYVQGSAAEALSELRVPVGERLTGWVAAHRAPVWNAEAALDLLSLPSSSNLTLGSSVPLCVDDVLIGVLTLYCRDHQEASIGERIAIERLLPTLSTALHSAATRPALAVDCAQEQARTAALEALDSLVAHGRHNQGGPAGAMVAIYITHLASDLRKGTGSSATSTVRLATALSPAYSSNRCVLRFPSDNLLLCSLDQAPTDALVDEVNDAIRSIPIQVSCIAISTSLELQHNTRRLMQTKEEPLRPSRFGDGVH